MRVRHLHLVESGDGDDVEAGSPIHEGLGNLHIVDGGSADEREGARRGCYFGVIFVVEGDLLMRPLQLGVMNRGRLPALVGGGGSSVVGKRETRLYEPEERLHSFRRGVKTGAFCSASRNASE